MFVIVLEHLRGLYNHAGGLHCWQVVRYCSSLLGHTVDSISPFITAVLVHGKQVSQYTKTPNMRVKKLNFRSLLECLKAKRQFSTNL